MCIRLKDGTSNAALKVLQAFRTNCKLEDGKFWFNRRLVDVHFSEGSVGV